MKKVVVLTGAGISAESGLKTFRDANGLWEGHDVTKVASPEGWKQDPKLVLDFYNKRRKQALAAEPNDGHLALVELEKYFKTIIITQNVDSLHEKAKSTNIIHLHGELFKSRSISDESLVYDINGWELNWGDQCELGSQLRPHIVWFGELVPMMENAVKECAEADIFIVIGTSLEVYPAASLINYVAPKIPKYVVDPNAPKISGVANLNFFNEPASTGVRKVLGHLVS